MAKTREQVTMRVRVGDRELEVTGPRDFVEAKISAFLGELQRAAERPETSRPSATGSKRQTGSTKAMSAAQFFRKVAPKTDVDRMLAAGFYLERYKNLEGFTAVEAKELIRSAKIPPPKNPNDAVNKNIKKAFVMSAGDRDGRMVFVLTSDGEQEIESLLTD